MARGLHVHSRPPVGRLAGASTARPSPGPPPTGRPHHHDRCGLLCLSHSLALSLAHSLSQSLSIADDNAGDLADTITPQGLTVPAGRLYETVRKWCRLPAGPPALIDRWHDGRISTSSGPAARTDQATAWEIRSYQPGTTWPPVLIAEITRSPSSGRGSPIAYVQTSILYQSV